ncbi:HEAT repeat domain-containing protein [Actinoplanes sp. NPDC026619]|uniref:HEAT repeat domain-containing protein n=1 Tax=Actinoplanes sp. NPDC026619 TaxID=3155798 RepID=UPI0033EAFFD9
MSDILISVALGALGNAVADAIAAMGVHRHYQQDPERRALSAVVARSSSHAFAGARRPGLPATDDWIDAVAEQWTPAFTPDVVAQLISVIAAPSAGNQRQFELILRAALEDAGGDVNTLEQTVSVEEFAHAFPDRLRQELMRGAHTQPELRELTQLLLAQRAEHRESRPEPSGPRDYRQDISDYLHAILDDARSGLPEFVPRDRAAHLDQRVRVRQKSRVSDRSSDQQGDRAYLPPVEFAGLAAADPPPEQSWTELRRSARRVVVLSDPGLGKSWLVRNETIRLAREALDALREDREVIVPVPIRADRLAEASGRSIGDVVARYFTGKDQFAERSRARFAEQVDAGGVHLLVDGLDEVPDNDARRTVRAALADWSRRAGARRWLVTSRIAGYTGIDSGDVTEIELLSLTESQVGAYVSAWGLEAPAEGRLRTALADPAVSGMARIPLLLALLCALAGSGEEIPRTRAATYERMLLWFLERPHRGSDRSGRDNVALLELIAGVAFHFAHRDTGWVDLMPRDALARAVAGQPTFQHLAGSADQLIEQLSGDLGLIVPEGDWSGGRKARYLFVHRTFAEYLVARHLADLSEQRRWAVVESHLWFDPEWLQVISMLGGRLETGPARRLVAQLSDVGADAFRQAWLMAMRVISEHPGSDDLLTPDARQAFQHTLAATLRHPDLRWYAVAALRSVPVPAPAAVRVLLPLTEADDASVRLAAVRSLAGVDWPDPSAHLIARLHDEEDQVAEEAAKALAGRPAIAVVDALLAEICTDRHLVSRACVDALVALPEARRIEAVTPYLTADQPTAIRIAAFPVLKGAGAAASPLIRTGLADQDPDIFAAAAESLDGPLDQHTEATLLQRLSAYMDKSAAGADMIIWNGPHGRRGDTDAQAARAALDRAGSQAPGFTAAYLRQVIDRNDGFNHYGDPSGPAAPTGTLIRELLLRLANPDHSPRWKASRALRAMRPDGIGEELTRLLDSGDRETVLAALEAAHGRRDDGLLSKVTELLAHSDDDIRAAAIEVVIEREPANLHDVLISGLRDASPQVRRLSADACAGRGDVRLVAGLLERIREPRDQPGVAVPAIMALRGRDEPGVRDALLACLRSRTEPAAEPDDTRPDRLFVHFGPPIHVAAARVLGEDEPEAVLAELAAGAEMHDGYRGREVVSALRRCRAPGTVDFLVRMRREGARKTRIAAYNTLLDRPYPEDLVTLVDCLDGLPPEMLHDLIRIAGVLATRHYHQLSEGERLHVREGLTNAIAAWQPAT